MLGKFVLSTVFLTTIFVGDGWLVVSAETAILFANIAAKFNWVSFP